MDSTSPFKTLIAIISSCQLSVQPQKYILEECLYVGVQTSNHRCRLIGPPFRWQSAMHEVFRLRLIVNETELSLFLILIVDTAAANENEFV